MIINPDYPHIVLSFAYRGFTIQIDRSTFQGQDIYAAWADHAFGCAVAVPYAPTRADTIRKAKQWVDQRLAS